MKKLTTLLATLALLFFLTPSDVSAVACSEPTPGEAYTTNTSCSFSRTLDGVDGGSITVAEGNTLTINSGQTVVWAPGESIVISGSIQNSGGSLVQDTLWVVDTDDDGYANEFTWYRSADKPANSRRVSTLTSRSTTDCDDGDANYNVSCYSYSQGYYYSYSQGRYWRYGYSQGWYYGYGQGWYYGYGQGWYYGYGQGRYWRYGYGQGSYGGYGCFIAGTKILMADGSYKNIEEVRPGDEVVSYNLSTGEQVTDSVRRLLVHPNNPGGYLILNDDLKVTGNHRVWVVNKSAWLRADELKTGDELLTPDGNSQTIFSIEKVEGNYPVYNLGLPGDNHNYFTENVLVHNWWKA